MQHAFEQLFEKLGWFCVTFKNICDANAQTSKKTQASQNIVQKQNMKHKILWKNLYVLM
jgi:hypothetical protein